MSRKTGIFDPLYLSLILKEISPFDILHFLFLVGNLIPVSQVREDVVAAYKKEVEWRTSEMLLPYKKVCAQRKVEISLIFIF